MGNPLTRAGKRYRPIKILRRNVTTNVHNEEVPGAPTEVPTLASVLFVRASERLSSDETVAETEKRFILGPRPDPPTVKDAIEFDGRTYAILNVEEIGTREGWDIRGVARAE